MLGMLPAGYANAIARSGPVRADPVRADEERIRHAAAPAGLFAIRIETGAPARLATGCGEPHPGEPGFRAGCGSATAVVDSSTGMNMDLVAGAINRGAGMDFDRIT